MFILFPSNNIALVCLLLHVLLAVDELLTMGFEFFFQVVTFLKKRKKTCTK